MIQRPNKTQNPNEIFLNTADSGVIMCKQFCLEDNIPCSFSVFQQGQSSLYVCQVYFSFYLSYFSVFLALQLQSVIIVHDSKKETSKKQKTVEIFFLQSIQFSSQLSSKNSQNEFVSTKAGFQRLAANIQISVLAPR